MRIVQNSVESNISLHNAGRYSERRDESVDGTGAIRVPLHGLAAVVAEIAEASGG